MWFRERERRSFPFSSQSSEGRRRKTSSGVQNLVEKPKRASGERCSLSLSLFLFPSFFLFLSAFLSSASCRPETRRPLLCCASRRAPQPAQRRSSEGGCGHRRRHRPRAPHRLLFSIPSARSCSGSRARGSRLPPQPLQTVLLSPLPLSLPGRSWVRPRRTGLNPPRRRRCLWRRRRAVHRPLLLAVTPSRRRATPSRGP